jgi:hypothetical protein
VTAGYPKDGCDVLDGVGVELEGDGQVSLVEGQHELLKSAVAHDEVAQTAAVDVPRWVASFSSVGLTSSSSNRSVSLPEASRMSSRCLRATS